MDKASFSDLFKRYLEDRISEQELRMLLETARQAEWETYLDELLANVVENELPYSSPENIDLSHIRHHLMTEVVKPETPVHHISFVQRWWWAACIILMLGLLSYLWTSDKRNIQAPVVAKTEEITPGKDGAILTLSDGSQIVLDSLGTGLVAYQTGAEAIIKNGGLIYNSTGEKTAGEVYNTMSTPKGRQFSVVLPDGTKVWLNALSAITYPTVFKGPVREVKISGEAFFEVKTNAEKQFIVNTSTDKITVLGTSFNVNAYADEEAVRTSLLEGALNVNHTNIKPGQAYQDGKVLEIAIEQEAAWKDGVFDFRNISTPAALRQLARWYDVEIIYDGKIPTGTIGGRMGRNLSLQQVLEGLDGIIARFRLEGRELHISSL